MSTVRIAVLLFITFSLCGCRKNHDKVYSITGRLLESSGNPVPVTNYSLSLYQRGSYSGIIAGASSASASATTNTEGYFEFKYTPGKGFFIAIPTTNAAPVSITSDYNNPASFQIFWENIPSLKDTALQNVFLFKLVKSGIIKVQSSTSVLKSDTINIQATTKGGYYKKNITGISIPANTEVAIDTIKDVIYNNFDFYSKRYQGNIAVGKNKRMAYTYGYNEPGLDETEKTYKFFVQ